MSREEILKNNYAMFWEKQSYLYGVGDVEKYVFRRIAEFNPKDAFEIGIGNGFPYATHLQESGVLVSGCDIAPLSVWNAKKNLKLEHEKNRIICGDINQIDIPRQFDLVYCLRSSWYIPDFLATIRKMAGMTRPGGVILFDIMDSTSFMAVKDFMLRKLPKWLVKIYIDLPILDELGTIFHSKKKIEKLLNTLGYNFEVINENKIEKVKRMKNQKVMFVCRKR